MSLQRELVVAAVYDLFKNVVSTRDGQNHVHVQAQCIVNFLTLRQLHGDVIEREWTQTPWTNAQFRASDIASGLVAEGVSEHFPTFQDSSVGKPTWAVLQTTCEGILKEQKRSAFLDALTKEEEKQICTAYLSDQSVVMSLEQEILYRLRASSSELRPKDLERNRLHRIAEGLKQWAEDASRTTDELDLIDPTVPVYWRAPPSD